MKKLLTFALMLCLFGAYAQKSDKKLKDKITGNEQGGVSKKDKAFVSEAADGGLLEVKLGQLAQQNAKDPEVKKHAMHMVTDHSKANEELKMLCAQKNMEVPAMLSDKSQKKYDKLAEMSGEKFDKEYVDCMVKDHQKMLAMFKKQSKNGEDPELKAWAGEKIATLESHLEMWKSVEKANAKGSTATR